MAAMDSRELLDRRLHNQRLTHPARKPEAVVRELVAMQAQEYAMAKWAIGLRMDAGATDDDVQCAFDAGRILRTHVMRPTWHFVAPADIRWLLELTAPRVHQANAFTYRQVELDAKHFKRGDATIVSALRDGGFLTREALQAALAKSKLRASGTRLAALVMHAELEGLICSGPRVGRKFTYALMEDRVPAMRHLKRDEALAELARRYFTTRGPATAEDFSTWSGLTLEDSRNAAESLGKSFSRVARDTRTLIYKASRRPPSPARTFLMPDYDEYGMSYRDRKELFTEPGMKPAFNRMIVVDGRIVGSWRPQGIGKREVETALAKPVPRTQLLAIRSASDEFLRFRDGAR
jgi:hypothetical protein